MSRLRITGGSWCRCGIKQGLKQIKCVWTGLCVRASPLDSAEVRAVLTLLGLYSFALFKWLLQTWTFWIQLVLTNRTDSILNLFYVALDLTNSYFNCQKMLQHTGQNPMQKIFSRWFQIIFNHRFIYISISVRSTTMGITLQKIWSKFMNESVVHMHVQKTYTDFIYILLVRILLLQTKCNLLFSV